MIFCLKIVSLKAVAQLHVPNFCSHQFSGIALCEYKVKILQVTIVDNLLDFGH